VEHIRDQRRHADALPDAEMRGSSVFTGSANGAAARCASFERIEADLSSKYAGFICADGQYTSIGMPTALHPQTIMAFTFADQVFPRKFGYPMKIRIPTKPGFKNPKFVAALSVTNNYPGGFWEDYGYNWFSGS